jgi:transcriptional regulator with XRE-family HTH domain
MNLLVSRYGKPVRIWRAIRRDGVAQGGPAARSSPDREVEMSVPTEPKAPAFTGAQLRAARALLGWTTQKLAAEADVSLASIRRAELGAGSNQTIHAVASRIVRALGIAGVEFTAAAGRGPGVAFREPSQRLTPAPQHNAQAAELLAL